MAQRNVQLVALFCSRGQQGSNFVGLCDIGPHVAIAGGRPAVHFGQGIGLLLGKNVIGKNGGSVRDERADHDLTNRSQGAGD